MVREKWGEAMTEKIDHAKPQPEAVGWCETSANALRNGYPQTQAGRDGLASGLDECAAYIRQLEELVREADEILSGQHDDKIDAACDEWRMNAAIALGLVKE